MGRRVMQGKSVPDLCADLGAESVGQRLATVDVQVVHHQVDGCGVRILERQIASHPGELESGAVRRGILEDR